MAPEMEWKTEDSRRSISDIEYAIGARQNATVSKIERAASF